MANTGKPHIEADKLANLPEYVFARINSLRMRARQSGLDVIDLGMGNPDMPTPQHIVDKLCEVVSNPKTHGYSSSRGIVHIRKAISEWYERRFNVSIDPETEAIACIGSKEGISHVMLALLNEGDLVVVPSPTYPSHFYSVAIAGGRLFDVPLTEETDFLPDLSSITRHVFPRAKILVLSYPHNPTTRVVDLAFFENVVEFAKREGLLIIHDLAYSEICFDGYTAPSFLQAPGAKEVGVEFYSLSKTYNMAGWRVGFAVGRRDVIKALAKLKSYYDYGVFTPIQVAAIAALRGPDDCIRKNVEEYQRRRDTMIRGLERIGWHVPSPKATMYVWAPIPEPFRAMGSLKFCELLLEKALVAAAPGSGFGARGDGYVRFALVENENRIRQAVRGMKKVLQSAQEE
jgi:alanine-synthesizing transaminase